ncbi:leukocyte elastase inhibitor-like isoform X2 [Leptotrombidium deliense]|uniref:Leukocyte elastase inhibitor-like isoform X2 n=1 Tax=Leptotrombidium deliense TaxID=299467 RepID=A0A443S8J3_9ACAR|nr:leukocyte elastase inhibitor-like isoform X2 [Leptotrombidium deliense]
MNSLSLVMLGARGSTRTQLMEALKYKYNFDNFTTVHQTFRTFHEVMKNVDGDVILKHANRALMNHDFQTSEEFKAAARKYYNASVEDVDFEEDGDKIVDDTNAWISKNTNKKIKNLIKHKFPKVFGSYPF